MLTALALLAQSAVATPPVVINHFYIAVDHKTFQAMRSSKWLKDQFAEVTMGTNSSGAETWTGLYVYGLGSYVEIFEDGDRHKEGSAGVGFLTSTPGGADDVYYHFRKSPFGARTERELMKIGTKTQQSPFAHIVSYSGQDATNLNLWLMEYHAEYYKGEGAPVGSTEAEVFAAYRSNHKLVYKGLMGDITGLTLRPAGDGKDAQAALDLLGFKQSGVNFAWYRGEQSLRVLPPLKTKPHYAITSATFSLRTKPKSPHIERFGPRSQLKVSPDGTAEWRFQ